MFDDRPDPPDDESTSQDQGKNRFGNKCNPTYEMGAAIVTVWFCRVVVDGDGFTLKKLVERRCLLGNEGSEVGLAFHVLP